MTDETPFMRKSYPIPLEHREKVDKKVKRMLKYGIVERSMTTFINSMVPVTKKDSLVRLCMDAREFNQRLHQIEMGPKKWKKFLENVAI